MELQILLVATLFSILAMTGFSIFITYITKCECREPVLLARLVNTWTGKEIHGTSSYIIGWFIHYSIGLFFMFFYDILWQNIGASNLFWTSLIFGAVIGTIGILGWMIIFRLFPTLPRLNYKLYYSQLFFAHIIFSVVAFLVYFLF